jgi:tetratricopeptide (TPR) repeat protein
MTKESKSVEPIAGNESKDSQAVQTQQRTIKYDNRTYSWTGKRWIDIQTFTSPPYETINKLNAILLSELKKEDEKITDFQQLLDSAVDAKEQTQYSRAERLVRKALHLSPGNLGAVAILCSCLRALGKPEEALKESTPYGKENYPPLTVTRAAAFCDLGSWEAAKMEIGKVLSLEKKNDAWRYSEPYKVLNRIKAVRPDLWKGK